MTLLYICVIIYTKQKVKEEDSKMNKNIEVFCEKCHCKLDVEKSKRVPIVTVLDKELEAIVIECVECGNINCMQYDDESTISIVNNIAVMLAKLKKEKRESEKKRILKDLHRMDSLLDKKRRGLKEVYENHLAYDVDGNELTLKYANVEKK